MYFDISRLFYMKVTGQLYNAAALPPPLLPTQLVSRMDVHINKNQCLCRDIKSGLPFRIQRALLDYEIC
jgi:hypothetical protein